MNYKRTKLAIAVAIKILILWPVFQSCDEGQAKSETDFEKLKQQASTLVQNHTALGSSQVFWNNVAEIDYSNSIKIYAFPVLSQDDQKAQRIVGIIEDDNIKITLWTLTSKGGKLNNEDYTLTTHDLLRNFTGNVNITNLQTNEEHNYFYKNGSVSGLDTNEAKLNNEDWPSACQPCHGGGTVWLPEVPIYPEPDPDPFDPCSYSYNPCTCDGIGCPPGGVGSAWPSSTVLFQQTNGKITDPSDYNECFKTTAGSASASMTLYVDQPTPNSRDTWSGSPTDPNVGHCFISITQGGITRVFGFYPNTGVNPFTSPSANSTLVNDGTHGYDVKITTSLTRTELQNVLNFANNPNGTYNLNTYNCTDFAIQCMKQGGVTLPDTSGSWPGGSGSNPGDLGQDIRNLPTSSNYTVNKNGGTAPANSGSCP